MHARAQDILSLPVWAAGHSKKMRVGGRVRVRAKHEHARMQHKEARTCVSGDELEYRTQPLPCAAAQSTGLWAAPARNMLPGRICTRAEAGRDTIQQPEMSEQCHSQTTTSACRQIRSTWKDQDGFLPSRRTAKIGRIPQMTQRYLAGKLPR